MSHEQKIYPGNVLVPARGIDFAAGGNQQPISGAAPEADIKGWGLITVIRREFERFFDSTARKQQQKRTKYREIIGKLEFRKCRLQQKIAAERKRDADSSRYRHLNMKLNVVSQLISRAHQKRDAIPD